MLGLPPIALSGSSSSKLRLIEWVIHVLIPELNKAAQQCAMAHKVPTPAHPHFVGIIVYTNKEQIENPKITFWEYQKTHTAQVIFKKLCMNDKIASKANNSVE